MIGCHEGTQGLGTKRRLARADGAAAFRLGATASGADPVTSEAGSVRGRAATAVLTLTQLHCVVGVADNHVLRWGG